MFGDDTTSFKLTIKYAPLLDQSQNHVLWTLSHLFVLGANVLVHVSGRLELYKYGHKLVKHQLVFDKKPMQ